MRINKYVLLLILTTIFAFGVVTYPGIQKKIILYKSERENQKTMEIIKKANLIRETVKRTEKTLPIEAYLDVNFICQAPLETEANWVHHEESCEEAALLQTYLYETGQKMTKQEAHEEIMDMLAWQEENFGGHHDIYADKIKEMAMNFYGLKDNEIKIIYNATLEDIKKQIANGHPVIAPVTAHFLHNPYYEHPGYHMLQVIGYTQDKIITNDNGTKRGANFSYDNKFFESALKDSGADIMIIEPDHSF